MPLDLLVALIGFAAATAWTPGPNNLMLLASGVNFGFMRTIPHLLGINFGFPAMIVLVGLGLGGIFTAIPQFFLVLKVLGIAYMLWLAWHIANAGPMDAEAKSAAKPMRFHEAVLFQWVNPKAWAMALTGAATYTVPAHYLLSHFTIAATFLVVNLPGACAWIGFGVGLRKLLQDPVRVRVFNITMAVLLVASLLPVLWELR